MSQPDKWRLFNVDSMLAEFGEDADRSATAIDICVAALCFKNFDDIPKRRPFLFESVTCNPLAWLNLIDGAAERYWDRTEDEGIAVYAATEHCGCIRTYRFRPPNTLRHHQCGREWTTMRSTQALYDHIDTPAARAVHLAWLQWAAKATQTASTLAEGRFNNTTVTRSLIMTGVGSCIACGAPPVGDARATIGAAGGEAFLVQIPVCTKHLEAARAEPSVMAFLSKLFGLTNDLPFSVRSPAIPDDVILVAHDFIAYELRGSVGEAERRGRGWHLWVDLPSGWRWLLRLNTLDDYAYMLFKPGERKEVYRADSARDHPELPFFPDHEHSKPDRKKDVASASFLYGNPFFDLQRLRDVSTSFCAI